MPDSSTQLAPAALIVGCGYLGMHVASQLMQRGITVYGTTRTEARARQLFKLGIQPLLASVTHRVTLASFKPALQEPLLDVVYLVPPGRPGGDPSPHDVLINGSTNVLGCFRSKYRADLVRRAVVASSTTVYGQTGDVRVDASTPAQPNSERGRLILQAEQLWLSSHIPSHVIRFAGIYGPGRIIGLQAVREQFPIVGNPQAMLNLIHVEDAARLVLAILESSDPAPIELGSDGSPCPRLDYYQHLAKKLGVPDPPVLDDTTAARQLGMNIDRLRRTSSKVCDIALTRARTGWSPLYADYRMGLEALFNPT